MEERFGYALGALIVLSCTTNLMLILLVIGIAEKGVCVG